MALSMLGARYMMGKIKRIHGVNKTSGNEVRVIVSVNVEILTKTITSLDSSVIEDKKSQNSFKNKLF